MLVKSCVLQFYNTRIVLESFVQTYAHQMHNSYFHQEMISFETISFSVLFGQHNLLAIDASFFYTHSTGN